MSSVIAEITSTPPVGIYDGISANIYKTGTEINMSYSIDYADLTPAQKLICDQFSDLVVSLAPTSPIG